jgi:Oxidoreductase family, NAD-binding Rossmann fold
VLKLLFALNRCALYTDCYLLRAAFLCRDPKAYLTAIDAFDAGDACTIFTPDDTHFAIALAAVQRGLHTMVTKPVVKTLDEHRQLYEAAKKAGVLVMVEVRAVLIVTSCYCSCRDKVHS